MRMRLTKAFESKVARRLALLFFACALVPLGGLALITSIRVSRQLDAQAHDRLRDDVKSLAMEGLGQLDLLSDRLHVLGMTVARGNYDHQATLTRIAELFPNPPEAMALSRSGAEPRKLVGDLTWPSLSSVQNGYLKASGRLLLDAPHGRLVLLVRIGASRREGVIAARFDPATLFGLHDEVSTLPKASDAYVFVPSGLSGCSAGVPQDVVVELASRIGERDRTNADPMVQGSADRYYVQTRTVPLMSLYGGESWTLAMIRPETFVRGPLANFLRDSWMVALMSGLIVTWLSLQQIRRQLHPLAALTAATRRLARRQFDQPVVLHSHDEFEGLGRAFNNLSDQLRAQFAELEAFNFGTLAALGRAIDAKSPWTAGHSERVTTLAVAIAKEMGLSEDEITDLSRGGLIHDIGKLATPPGILDKPGQLTPEEIEVLREHPRKGVHILEPIPAFRRLLPIVGQHHERWDGGGYPDGLAGDAIARTARVLAVADVADALSSDRPYRQGLPMKQVRDTIAASAGQQFDPAVVEAFLRLKN